MSCATNRDVLELYALGVLDEPERSEVEEHLNSKCGACTDGLRAARVLNTAVLGSLPLQEPSPLLRARIANSIRPGSKRKQQPIAWIGLAAGLAAVGLWFGSESRQRSVELANAQLEVRALQLRSAEMGRALDFLRDPQTRPASAKPGANEPRGTYFVNPGSGVMLIASNLPIPAPGRAYEMWVIPKGQAPVPAGVFVPDANGSAVHLQTGPVDLNATQAFAISEEPESGSAAPTTTPFLVTPAQGA